MANLEWVDQVKVKRSVMLRVAGEALISGNLLVDSRLMSDIEAANKLLALQRESEFEQPCLLDTLKFCAEELHQLHEQVHPNCIADRPKRCPSRTVIEEAHAAIINAGGVL